MENLAIYFLLFAAVCTKDIWCRTYGGKGFRNESRIVGGKETTIEQYPYLAYLVLNDGRDSYSCGGSIISENHIVTAAHCLTGVQSIRVRIGSTYSDAGGKQYETTHFKSHQFYSPETNNYDVGVVFIDEGMELDGKTARAIALASSSDPKPREKMVIAGWGDTSEGGSPSNVLKAAVVPVVSRSECQEELDTTISVVMFCAGGEGEDTCQGDSGGPAVSTSSGELEGITSFGIGCARPDKPGVYTRVGQIYIRSFIRGQTGV